MGKYKRNASVQLKNRRFVLKKRHECLKECVHKKSYSTIQKKFHRLKLAKHNSKKEAQRRNIYSCFSIFSTSLTLVAIIFAFAALFFTIWTPCVVLIRVSMEGMKSILSTAGIVCFVLTYINTSKTRSMKGFLFDDVVGFHFPCYGIIFCLHAFFVLWGTYCYYYGKITTVGFCSIGVITSMIYAVAMAIFAIFWERGKSALVKKYIEAKLSTTISDAERMELIFSLGKYVFDCHKEKWSTSSILQIYNNHNDSKALPCLREDMQALLKLLTSPSPLTAEESKDLLCEFEIFFSPKNFNNNAAYLLQKQNIVDIYPYECSVLFETPAYRDEIKRFSQHMLYCYRLWESLLGNSPDTNTQSAIIYAVLCESSEKRIKMAYICCGLLLYLKVSLTHGKDNCEADGWQQLMLCLYNGEWLDNRICTHSYNGDMCKSNNFMQAVFRDLEITALALALLEQIATNKKIPLTTIQQMINVSLWREDIWADKFLSEQDALRYLCYATIIRRSITSPEIVKVTPPEMYLSLPKMVWVIIEWINGERDYESTDG